MSNDSKIPTFSQGRRACTRVCVCFKNSQNTVIWGETDGHTTEQQQQSSQRHSVVCQSL